MSPKTSKTKTKNSNRETLFIDARKPGTLINRVHRDLADEDIAKFTENCHAWKSGKKYGSVAGFCKSITLKEIQMQGCVLTPGRDVGAAELEEDDMPFDEKMKTLTETLADQFSESDKLENNICDNLKRIGYEF